MPSVAVKLYSVFFKFLLKHRLQNRIQTPTEDPFGITSRPEESIAAANPSFTDGVATKDIHIDPLTSLSIRIFLPESALTIDPHDPCKKIASKSFESGSTFDSKSTNPSRRNSYGSPRTSLSTDDNRRSSYDHAETPANSGSRWDENGHPQVIRSDRAKIEGTYLNYNSESGSVKEQDLGKVKKNEPGVYRGYLPADNLHLCRKLPIMLQFHGGGFVAGSNDSAANDFFCRRIAKLCDAVVIAVGYRLAPENRYPAAFDDGLKVLNWLGKQANLAECSKSLGNARRGSDLRRSDVHRHIVDTFGASMVEPWLAAHGDPSRCVLLGVSCGANIADFVARKAVAAGKLLEPVKVVAQVLMYPFFIGSVPTHSEIKLANSYFYDKAMCILAWKLFLPEPDFSLDHPAANPLVSGREPALRFMPPTLTVVAEHDWMRDRAIAYSEELRKVNIDSPVLEYKDAVHEFATLDMLLRTPQAHACAEDIAIWVKKYISLRGHEFSY